MPFETKANNEGHALDNMLKHFKENTEALTEFTKNYAISSGIFAAICALASS